MRGTVVGRGRVGSAGAGRGGTDTRPPDLGSCLADLRRFEGAVVVVKFGGNAMVDGTLKAAFARDVVFLRYAGLRPVVVHGGGPQIGAQLSRLGLESSFVGGLRVTTPEAMDVVRMVLAGQVQRELVGLINAHGPFAVGLTGEDAGTMTAVKRFAELAGERVDIGLVGDVGAVRPSLIESLLAAGRIPVVSSVAPGPDGAVYNVNADTAAAAVAGALRADVLLMLTDVPGLYPSWPPRGGVIPRLDADELTAMLPDLGGGMVPKMRACLTALGGGVGSVRVLDGRERFALVRAFGADAPGTEVVPPSGRRDDRSDSRSGGRLGRPAVGVASG